MAKGEVFRTVLQCIKFNRTPLLLKGIGVNGSFLHTLNNFSTILKIKGKISDVKKTFFVTYSYDQAE